MILDLAVARTCQEKSPCFRFAEIQIWWWVHGLLLGRSCFRSQHYGKSVLSCWVRPLSCCMVSELNQVHLQQQHRSGQILGTESKTAVRQPNKP